jgi:hypothetical protein
LLDGYSDGDIDDMIDSNDLVIEHGYIWIRGDSDYSCTLKEYDLDELDGALPSTDDISTYLLETKSNKGWKI